MSTEKELKLARGLSFSTDIITEVIDIVAARGAGKTYTATKIAGLMLEIGAQVVVVDPVGNWYGLRLGADGKVGGGLDIKIIGGNHGDIPLEPTSGPLIAKTIVETGMSAILDISLLSKANQNTFAREFAENILEHRKRDPAAMHIFWEEAYRFMPQRLAKGGDSKMLEATEELVTMGRNFGIGCTIVCQRAAQVSKTVLTQASVLICMNTTGLADRKVLEEWLEYKKKNLKGGAIEDAKLPNLSALRSGEAVVWWPGNLKTAKQVKILKKKTYDASATPKFGEKRSKKTLKPIDMAALENSMSDMIEKVRSEDPRVLKHRIATLQRELKAALSKKPEAEVVEVKAVDESQIKRLEESVGGLMSSAKILSEALKECSGPTPRAYRGRGLDSLRGKTADILAGKKTAKHRPENPNGNIKKLPRGAMNMLKALASASPGGLTKSQVALAAVLKSSSGTFSSYWSSLNSSELIRYDSINARWYITEKGFEILGSEAPTCPDTPEAKLEFWCERLPGKAKGMLRLLFENRGDLLSRDEIADSMELSAASGTFSTYLSRLTSNGLALKYSGGRYAISEDMFA